MCRVCTWGDVEEQEQTQREKAQLSHKQQGGGTDRIVLDSLARAWFEFPSQFWSFALFSRHAVPWLHFIRGPHSPTKRSKSAAQRTENMSVTIRPGPRFSPRLLAVPQVLTTRPESGTARS